MYVFITVSLKEYCSAFFQVSLQLSCFIFTYPHKIKGGNNYGDTKELHRRADREAEPAG